MTTALQQGTPEWHAARKGKLTASNVGAALGLCLWTSRKVAFNRAMGTDTFEGNDATRWGSNNEPNAILAYSAHTGNLVEKTGLHVHEHTPWLAGSPDGLVGTEGMVEAKCPYWKKQVHFEIPLYYYMQINLCLECANREWCDYISWTPDAYKVIRVTRDRDLHERMLPHYSNFFAAMSRGADGPPVVRKGELQIMRAMVISLLLLLSLLVNYNLRIINTKIRLFEAALERPEFNVSQKLGFYRELKKLERDRYIAIVAEHLD